jgi:hypothetical protein
MKEPEMDTIIRDAVVDYLEFGIPAGTEIVDAVMRRAVGRRVSPGIRVRWAVVGAIAAVLMTSSVVLALASGNWPIRLVLIPAQNAPSPMDKSGINGSAAPGADNVPGKVGPEATTLAAAERAFGRHVPAASLDSGAVLDAVYFAAARPLPSDAKPGSQASHDTVELVYTYAGTRVEVTEAFDPTASPLTVDALDQGGAKLKAAGGLGEASIESVAGSEYAVGRAADGAAVEWILWKTTAGLVMTAHFDPGVAHDVAFALVTALR